ncbi:YihY/virulence factor BrkB family protein [Streptomyces sp. NBC_00859]|uniref:YihY/virulence factor BrkB family protein n=1 Tax=Streptomyces sp. NBC_00859 TaxID=2903682 RepID=UPI003869A4ED|nr:YihY/virulence factor BrkB family protein [Streptomyces sp. NBC_00859]
MSDAQPHGEGGLTRHDEKTSGRRPEGPPHPRRGGLGQTVKRTLAEFKEDNLSDSAAALTYYAVLSVFPALIALVSLVGLVMDPKTIVHKATNLISSIGPASAVNTFKGPINDIASNRSTGTVLLIVGLASALWTASGYVGAFIRASNRIYEVEEGRSFFKLRPLQLLVTLILVLLQALVLIALVVTGPFARKVGSAIGAGDAAVTAWNYAKWPVLVVVVLLIFSVLYYASPNARLSGLKAVLPGSALALVLWLVASVGFAFYVANFASYNQTYGTLGGIIVFLVWLWITNLAVLLGAEFNAERERSRQLAEGVPGAERELQVDERDKPKPGKRSRTA